ncbi:MAG: TVP38/TMEM64 family protein [Proteobacteria bacterium]|nr:TVP38/TMEM64 family protein [Pseudomonadota bacterium]
MAPADSDAASERAGAIAKAALLVVALAALLALARAEPFEALLAPAAIEARLAAAGPAAPAVFVLAMATAVVVSPIPSLPLDIAAGSVFGPYWGTLYAWLGAVLGAVLSFGLARALGRSLVERFLGGHIHFCRECSDHLLLRVVLVSRLVPVISFDVVSYGAGLTNLSLLGFATATALGTLPLTFVYVAFGGALLAEGPLVWGLGLALVVLFFLLPGWIERHDFLGLAKVFRHDTDAAPEAEAES